MLWGQRASQLQGQTFGDTRAGENQGMFMVEIASPGSVIRPPSHSYSGSYETTARKGPQKGRSGSGIRLHPKMPSLMVCNTKSHSLHHLATSVRWQPLCTRGVKALEGSVPFWNSGAKLGCITWKPSLFPTLHSRVAPGTHWCSGHFPALSRERLQIHISRICQPEADLP